MLRSLKILLGETVVATDADIGKVHDFYFHDDTWIVRYLVVDTGHWLPGRKVLITPSALGKPDCDALTLPVALTRGQVEVKKAALALVSCERVAPGGGVLRWLVPSKMQGS